MTLSRQLIISLLLVIIILMGGMFLLSIRHVQTLLTTQMEVQTQNSADSLAIALKRYLAKGDLRGAETFVDGFFNRGFYQKLTIIDPHKEQPMLVRETSRAINGVPEWFVRLIPLTAPVKKAEVFFYDSGHRKKNFIILEAKSSYAYEQLWSSVMDWLLLSVVLISAGAVLFVLLIRWQLAPLKMIEDQAIAITRREFPTIDRIPHARELARVVLAMNGMATKLKQIINDLTERAERLMRETRLDHVTGLMNRQSFMDNLETVMSEKGVLAIIHVQNLKTINTVFGYPTGDEFLRTIARYLRQERELYNEAFTGRISGSDFALTTPGLDLRAFHNLYKCLGVRLESLSVPEANVYPRIRIGVTSYREGESTGKVLARANHALSISMHQDRSLACVDSDDGGALTISSTDWGKLIDDVIHNGRIRLTSQKVVRSNGEPLFTNLLARPEPESGETIRTASFVAMAERLGRGIEFDRLVVSKVVQYAQGRDHAGPWAIKLLASSWYDDTFFRWFTDLLEQHPGVSGRLFVICTENTLIRDHATSGANINAIRQHNGRIVMDHFGGELGSFTALCRLKPDYIRLDGGYVRDIARNKESRMFLEIVTDIAQGLDIGLIAEHVETDEIRSALSKTGLDAFQGYAISRIESLDE
jgi:diguanylate cyclase (GGDEF)-like protein